VNIPFKRSFRHTLKERKTSESVFVKIMTESGEVGFGESLPRSYVTGETQESVITKLEQVLPISLLGKPFLSLEEAVNFCSTFKALSGAAKCAFELALLDSIAKAFNRSITDVFNGIKTKQLRYSAAIGSGVISEAKIAALKLRLLGVKDVKLKVGDEVDVDRLKVVRRYLGRNVDIRLDANCAWSAEEAIKRLTIMRNFNFSVIEQPVKKDDIDSLKKVADVIPEPVMADESLCDIEDAKKLIEQKACDMFNIRISKCGGILNSIKIAKFADQAGILYQLGCQIGETGVLSAAGRHFASCMSNIRYIEGSYAKFLLTEDIVSEDVSFGYRGFAHPLTGAGLGVTVNEQLLNKYVIRRVAIS
jgi:muconate cycloisomerase